MASLLSNLVDNINEGIKNANIDMIIKNAKGVELSITFVSTVLNTSIHKR